MELKIQYCDIDYKDQELNGTLYLDVEAITEDQSFDAYNGAGLLQNYGGSAVVGFKVYSAYFETAQGAELELEEQDIKQDQYLSEYVIDKLNEELEDE